MNKYQVKEKLMGCAFELIIYHENAREATDLLAIGIAEIKRIEQLLTEFTPDSITSKINKAGGKEKVQVPKEVYDLVQRSKQIAQLTQGAFDITIGPLKKLYDFKKQDIQFPTYKNIQTAINKIGHQYLQLSPTPPSIFLRKKQMCISFASIGKGYAADRVRRVWKSKGVVSGLINASGDLTTIGKKGRGEDWTIGIAHPDDRQKIMFYLPINNFSIATSGNYEQYFIHQGQRFGHTIDPKTGLPIQGIKSVSVTSPSAELCDALATAVYVLGITVGLDFINQLPKHIQCLIIDDKNRCHFSAGLKM